METQTSARIARRRGRPSRSGFETLPKVGMESSIHTSEKEKLTKSYYKRRQLLAVSDDILAAHPDKHFYWEIFEKLQKSGGYHEKGYRPFMRAAGEIDPENTFGTTQDNLVHRNEMVLMWMPKQEFELMEMEREVAEGKRDVSDVIRRRSDLVGFSPTSKIETRFVQNSDMEG